MKVKRIPVDHIHVVGSRRDVDPEIVTAIANSIKQVGLQNPITVAKRETLQGYRLIAGRHRLEAIKSLQMEHVECHVIEWQRRKRRLWEISENLHRADLSELERANQINEWRKLTKNQDGQLARPGGRQPQDRGIKRTAKALRLSREKVRRSARIAELPDSVKAAAKKAGVQDNQRLLLELAKLPSEHDQLEKIAAIKHSRQRTGGLGKRERKQIDGLRRALGACKKFRRRWQKASEIVRKGFIKKLMTLP